MARDVAGDARPMVCTLRTAADRKRRRLWAAASADNAIRSLATQLNHARDKLLMLEDALAQVCQNAELAQRLAVVAPALLALISGSQPTYKQKLARNVALHAVAKNLDIAAATTSQLRAAQKGPRLQCNHSKKLNPRALVFVPGTVWAAAAADELPRQSQ
eukprot:CAMPEP_0172718998 /NCGR_PEP_ID=MMETSP1074-20121228/75251_1 /TAXON_ID=2916 /ORGANISM="Ceratium fusus, Strain PA161109" /LENGTH=159 /DNA_ID=CAMNT_0013544299 /DNA_START=62 /DNA_END=538 /DNA_ORIENTATION=+